MLAAIGRLDEAVAAHHVAIAANPNFARAYVNLAHTAQLAGRIDEAVAAARRAVELVPGDVDARRNLAAALQETGDVGAAGRAYDEATALLAPAAGQAGAAGRVTKASTDRQTFTDPTPRPWVSPATITGQESIWGENCVICHSDQMDSTMPIAITMRAS